MNAFVQLPFVGVLHFKLDSGAFYGSGKGFGVGRFKSMEEKGKISKTASTELPDLCTAFCKAASALLAGIGALRISRELLDDLAIMTVGPQLRGGANNLRGADGIAQVFAIIRDDCGTRRCTCAR